MIAAAMGSVSLNKKPIGHDPSEIGYYELAQDSKRWEVIDILADRLLKGEVSFEEILELMVHDRFIDEIPPKFLSQAMK